VDSYRDTGIPAARSDTSIRLASPESLSDDSFTSVDSAENEANASAPLLPVLPEPVVGVESHDEVIVDLPSLLRLAVGENPQVNFARERIAAAEAQYDRARVQWLPSLYVGPRWVRHDGQIQDTRGEVLEVSRSSLFAGGGARLQVQMSDAYFAPRAAQHLVAARLAGEAATTNQTLLDVSLAYWDLVRAHGAVAIQQEAVANMTRLDDLGQAYLRAEKLKPADADRIRTELLGRKQELLLGEQDISVASARLARLVRMDPFVAIHPAVQRPVPVEYIITGTPGGELAATALANRPELAEHRALVQSACSRLRQAQYGPWLPSLVLDASGGGFGGGPHGFFGEFDGRSDVEAAAVWQFQNLGIGDRAVVRERASEVRQAQLRVVSLMDQVVTEAAEASARVHARQKQLKQAEQAVAAATDSFNRSLKLFTDGGIELILPLEVLQSIAALTKAQQDYLSAMIEYNRVQLQLQWALGFPVDAAAHPMVGAND
jgi:outer membrane protein TolC